MNILPNVSPEVYSTRLIDRLAFAHDASLYRVVQDEVEQRKNEKDIKQLFEQGNELRHPSHFGRQGQFYWGQAFGVEVLFKT